MNTNYYPLPKKIEEPLSTRLHTYLETSNLKR